MAKKKITPWVTRTHNPHGKKEKVITHYQKPFSLDVSPDEINKRFKSNQKSGSILTKVRSGVEISVDSGKPSSITKLSDLYVPFPETDVNFGKGSNAILSNFADVRPDKRIKVISGGQRGADKIGLEVAKELGFETGGTAPAKFSISGGKDPSLKDFGLKEITEKQTKAYQGSESFYGPRTERNVLDSDATLIFTVEGRHDSHGSKLTRNLAIKHRKPFLQNPTSEQISELVGKHNISTINIAGNREFKDKNIIKSALSSVKGKGLVFGRGGTIKRFRTAEGAYQAFKSGKYVSGFENLSGFDAKKLGKKINVDKNISESLMRDIVAERFDQDTPFREALLKTGDITHSVGDKHWSESFPRILEDVRDFDMKRSSTGKMERVPRKLRVPSKGPILKDITKQFTAVVERTVEQHKDLTKLPVKEKPIKRTQNLKGGPKGFVSQNRKGFITPDVKVQGWLTDMLKQVDDVNKSGGGVLKFFGHSLPANVWGDIVKTSLSGTMEHLDIGEGKGAYKFSLIDPDVKTWIEANKGVEEAILRQQGYSEARPSEAQESGRKEVLVKQQDTLLSAHKTRPNLEPVSPSQARNVGGSFGFDPMEAEVKGVKVQSTASAVFNVDEAEDFKWSNEGTKIVEKLDDLSYSDDPISDSIKDQQKNPDHTLKKRVIPTIFTGGTKEKKSEVIQKKKTIEYRKGQEDSFTPLKEAQESIRATEHDFKEKVNKVSSRKQSVQQTFLTSTNEVKLKEVDIPIEDRHERKNQKVVSQFEEDPLVRHEISSTSKEKLNIAKKQVSILSKEGLLPDSLPKKVNIPSQSPTDTIIESANPANNPLPSVSIKQKPKTIVSDPRYGINISEGDTIDRGTEFVPLGRKSSSTVTVLEKEPVLETIGEGDSLKVKTILSGGRVEIPDVFIGSQEKVIPEPKPVPLKEGEEIISSGTHVKSGEKQPASVSATTTDVKNWMKRKGARRSQLNWAMKGLIALGSVPVLDAIFTPLEVAQAHDTVIKPRQEKYGGSGLASGRDRNYGKVMKEGKRKVTPLTEFKNWEEWDVVKGFSAWAKNRSETARSLRR